MVKHITQGVLYLILLLLLIVLAVLLWAKQGPHDVQWLARKLESSVEHSGVAFDVKIDHAVIDWRQNSRFGKITLKHVVLSDEAGNAFATLPEMDVVLSPRGLVSSEKLLSRIELIRPRLYMFRDEAGGFRMGLRKKGNALPLEAIFAAFDSTKNAEKSAIRLPFDALTMIDARFFATDAASQTVLQSSALNMTLTQKTDILEASYSLPMNYGDNAIRIDGSLRMAKKTAKINSHMRMESVPLELVCRLMTCASFHDVVGHISGTVSTQINSNQVVESVNINLILHNLSGHQPEWFEAPLRVEEGELVARIVDGGDNITLTHIALTTPHTRLVASGNAQHTPLGWQGEFSGEAGPMRVEALKYYWPIVLAPQTREWVNTHLSKGRASKGSLQLAIKPGDLLQEHLPTEALTAQVVVENMQVDYLPDFPSLQEVNGTIDFTGTSMRIVANQGTALTGTVIHNASLDCPDLYHPDVAMSAKLNLTAPLGDVAEVLSIKHFTFDDQLKLNPKTSKGTAKGDMVLQFNAFTEKTRPDEVNLNAVDYDIRGTIENGAQKDIMGDVNIQNLQAEFSVSNKAIYAKGDAMLDSNSVKFTANQDGVGDFSVGVDAVFSHDDMLAFGMPKNDYYTGGDVGVKADVIVERDRTRIQQATINMKKAALQVPEISWKKPKGVSATLALKQSGLRNNLPLYTASVTGELLKARADIQFSDALDAITFAHIYSLTSADNDFSLQYEPRASGDFIVLKGKALDASAHYANQENSLLADFPAIDLEVDIGALLLMKELPLTNVKGNLRCTKIRCEQAVFTGKANSKSFKGRIIQEADARKFLLMADDAGDFLRALDITDRVFGGTLTLKGTYDDTQSPALLNGRLLIKNYTLKNSQILGRILSVGSLTGLQNLLTGSGIDFEKLSANIIAKQGIIDIAEGRGKGTALGFTVEGQVDTSTATVNIKGVLVPAFVINSLVSNIPIIGELAGGEGEGLIAFRYSVTGPYSDPDTMVNPLSGLTPGFLRGIFGIFEEAPSNKQTPNLSPDGSKP